MNLVQNRQIPKVALGLGAYALLAGLTALLGWVFDVERLSDWWKLGLATQPNTAVAAILNGGGLLLLITHKNRLALIAGGSALVLSAATLSENLFGLNFQIDTPLLFDRAWGLGSTTSPGRMGLPASISWALVGSGICLASRFCAARQTAAWCGLSAATIAAFSLFGYLFGTDMLYSMPRYTAIALPTSTMIFAAGLGLVAALPDREPMRQLLEDSAAGLLMRRALPFVILLPVLLGLLRTWGEGAGLYDTAMGTALLVLTLISLFCAVLWWCVSAVGKHEELIMREVAERKRAESQRLETETALRANEERLRLATQTGKVGIWEWDVRSNHVSWTDSLYGLHGVRKSEFNETVEGFVELVHPDDRARVTESIKASLTSDAPYELEFRAVRPDGQIVWIFTNAVVLRDGAQPSRMIGAATDITESKRAQEALRDADRRKDEFLAMLAHELRNPLAPLRNALDIMKSAAGAPRLLVETHGMMERQLHQMVRLIDDLMDVSRITRNRLEIRRECVELSAVVNRAIDTVRQQVREAGQTLDVSLPTEQITVQADSARLAQVLGNLLQNATKYTEKGGRIWLEVRRRGTGVRIVVRDNGVGIPADMLPNIFDIFTQVQSSLNRAQGGLGIGLSLVKRLVELHGGTVRARSAGLGRGSEFDVDLPDVIEPDQLQASSTPEPADAALAGRRILVVDDNSDAARSLAHILELHGVKAFTGGDGLQAVAQAGEHKPDVILLDIGLPKLNGYDACRTIRQQPGGKGIMMVALTGWGQDEDRRKSLDAGFDAHLVKPVDPVMILKLIDGSAHTEPRGRLST